MSLDAGRYKLHTAWKVLHERWQTSRLSWNDSVREEFNREFWVEIEPTVRSMLAAIDRLGQALAAMTEECD